MSNRLVHRTFNKAIGLLELMLALSVIALIVIMSTRYYTSAQTAQKIQAATDQVNAVRGAMQNAVVGINTNLGYVPSIGKLVTLGFLPPSIIGMSSMSAAAAKDSGINPWGGSIYVRHSSGLLFKVVVESIPSLQACRALKAKLEATSASPNSATCNSGSSSDSGDGETDTSEAAVLTAQYLF